MFLTISCLTFLNISDHFSRNRIEEKRRKSLGALLGFIDENKVLNIITSFELVLLEDETLDIQFLNQERIRYKQVFPSLEVFGWYSSVFSTDISVQFGQLLSNIDSVYFLQFPNQLWSIRRDATMETCDFTLLANDAEMISLKEIKEKSETSESLVFHLETFKNAIEILKGKLKKINVSALNLDDLNRLNYILNMRYLPYITKDENLTYNIFFPQFLSLYLASLTKGLESSITSGNLLSKFNSDKKQNNPKQH